MVRQPLSLPPERLPGTADFDRVLREHGAGPVTRRAVTTLQVSLGRRCNQACHHCHVEAGPERSEEMGREVAERLLQVLRASPAVDVVDLTGGAPELNSNFRRLVAESRRAGRTVIDRCNLTVLLEPGMAGLAEFLARHRVVVVASLPCYSPENVDRQRGRGVFSRSIEALLRLNRLGYGRPGSGLELNLVYNPGGAFLPPSQVELERRYKLELRQAFGVEFNRLLTLTNMPIKRFRGWLERRGLHREYMDLLMRRFNPKTIAELMCRSLVSVAYDGRIFDCDFNQMLEIGVGAHGNRNRDLTVWGIDSLEELEGRPVATASHCFGCTAGRGSSCSGALASD